MTLTNPMPLALGSFPALSVWGVSPVPFVYVPLQVSRNVVPEFRATAERDDEEIMPWEQDWIDIGGEG